MREKRNVIYLSRRKILFVYEGKKIYRVLLTYKEKNNCHLLMTKKKTRQLMRTQKIESSAY